MKKKKVVEKDYSIITSIIGIFLMFGGIWMGAILSDAFVYSESLELASILSGGWRFNIGYWINYNSMFGIK